MRNAPADEAGALAKIEISLGHSTGSPRHTLSRDASQASQRLLVFRYRAARARVDAGLDLIDRALDLRERLYFGLDLDDMAAEVRDFKRAVEAHRRRRITTR